MLPINPLTSHHRAANDDDFQFDPSKYGSLLSDGVYLTCVGSVNVAAKNDPGSAVRLSTERRADESYPSFNPIATR